MAGTGTRRVLLVEDDDGDVALARRCFERAGVYVSLSVARDGVEALSYLRREEPYAGAERPDLILLDLNLPRKNGREVLAEVKGDAALRPIPVIVLTTSDREDDIRACYDLGANCYLVKPGDLKQFLRVAGVLADFWFARACLPPRDP